MPDILKENSVFITGAGRGIGKRLAMGFAQAGMRVGLLARSNAEFDLAKLEIEQAGGQALRLPADVREPGQLSTAVISCGRSSALPVSWSPRGHAGAYRAVSLLQAQSPGGGHRN